VTGRNWWLFGLDGNRAPGILVVRRKEAVIYPTLSHIIEPHEVRDQKLLNELVAAYEADQEVSPPVVLDYGGEAAFALSGSHRLAAMREVFEDDATELLVDGGLLVWVDGEELYHAADEDQEDALDRLGSGRGDLGEIMLSVMPLLDESARRALEDQWH
jgi:hypothetical protein